MRGHHEALRSWPSGGRIDREKNHDICRCFHRTGRTSSVHRSPAHTARSAARDRRRPLHPGATAADQPGAQPGVGRVDLLLSGRSALTGHVLQRSPVARGVAAGRAGRRVHLRSAGDPDLSGGGLRAHAVRRVRGVAAADRGRDGGPCRAVVLDAVGHGELRHPADAQHLGGVRRGGACSCGPSGRARARRCSSGSRRPSAGRPWSARPTGASWRCRCSPRRSGAARGADPG
jgi:hypothetical protein